ncbi:MAG: hypothetical protein U9N42_11350 [Campylobacterota bacterium]|nr:hypothetical protein [Campylobacterota bacterium]
MELKYGKAILKSFIAIFSIAVLSGCQIGGFKVTGMINDKDLGISQPYSQAKANKALNSVSDVDGDGYFDAEKDVKFDGN